MQGPDEDRSECRNSAVLQPAGREQLRRQRRCRLDGAALDTLSGGTLMPIIHSTE
ncbi:hypothetical protein ACFOGJ_27310 [Marinibaculum pumilum]|uniref:Uncharacterized protein n=1 Tax=Marinibaculum pumilum TaxID=1766165 RepID=A0ABV7L9M2_9PROT